MDLSQLIGKSQAGDVEAFETLYKSYATRALRTVYLIHSSERDAQDIVQEAFLQAWRSLGSLRETEAFHVWFYRILMRVISRRRRKLRGFTLLPRPVELPDVADLSSPSPEEQVEHNEQLTALRLAVNALPATYRVPLVLRYYSRLTEAEVAQVLSVPLGTVKSRVHHARKLLSTALVGQPSRTQVPSGFPNGASASREVDAKC